MAETEGSGDKNLAILLQQVLPIATQKVRAALQMDDAKSEDDRRRQRQATALFAEAQAQSSKVTDALASLDGALASAVTELQRTMLSGGLTATLTTDQLASELVRIAYNRWQRRHRSDKRLRQEAHRGEAASSDRGNTVLAGTIGESAEFHAQILSFVNEIVERLSPKGREVLKMRLEGFTQDEVAKALKCHRSTVSRIETQVRDLVNELNQKSE
jgi:RNA polymerase sigma factor (sigma-70 family)